MNDAGDRERPVTRSLAARTQRLRALARVATRALSVDTNPVPASWTHVTKVDPERRRRLPLLYPRYLRHTDAVVVGGSTAVTGANTEVTFELLERLPRPVFHEPSDPTHVTDRTRESAAFIAIPQVLNGSTDAFVGTLGAGIERVQTDLARRIVDDHVPGWTPARVRDALADAATTWLLETAVFEAYLVQNPDSAAAREAGVAAEDVLAPDEARRRAMVAERYLDAPVVYLEYSGTFGGDDACDVLAAISDTLSTARLWYGGGLATRADVTAVRDAGADAVVVGNAFHAVATEEAELFSEAVADPTLSLDASRTQVDRWIRERLDVDTSAAAAYLSTVPNLSTPEARARTLLTDSVMTWLRLRAVASSESPSTRAESRSSPAGRLSRTDLESAVTDETDGFDPLTNPVWVDAALASVRVTSTNGAPDAHARHLSPAAVDAPGEASDGNDSPVEGS